MVEGGYIMIVHCIYKITNTVNGKIYIGQTNDPRQRQAQYKSAAKCENFSQIITRAIAKYGFDNFKFEIIAVASTQDAINLAEIAYIKLYNSRDPSIGYNIAEGGAIANTPETLKKISASLKKYYETHDGWLKGGTLTDEWKENISKASMGKPGTNVGKTFDDEWKVGISKSLADKPRVDLRRFSDEQEKEICRLYVEEEKSMYALGQQFDCQRTLIDDILQRNGVEKRKSNYTGHSNGKNIFTKEQEKEICEIYKSGSTSRSMLAKQLLENF